MGATVATLWDEQQGLCAWAPPLQRCGMNNKACARGRNRCPLEQGVLLGDSEPAAFWSSTPLNIWRNNVATGSCAYGYWFELAQHPNGLSYTTAICPRGQGIGGTLTPCAHWTADP